MQQLRLQSAPYLLPVLTILHIGYNSWSGDSLYYVQQPSEIQEKSRRRSRKQGDPVSWTGDLVFRMGDTVSWKGDNYLFF